MDPLSSFGNNFFHLSELIGDLFPHTLFFLVSLPLSILLPPFLFLLLRGDGTLAVDLGLRSILFFPPLNRSDFGSFYKGGNRVYEEGPTGFVPLFS